jgi:hypothetical protein
MKDLTPTCDVHRERIGNPPRRKDRLAIIAALDDVLGLAGDNVAREASHVDSSGIEWPQV